MKHPPTLHLALPSPGAGFGRAELSVEREN